MTALEPLPFVKGHGTENDFVLLPDREGTLELTADLTRRLCDRRAGIGADGAIRVAPGAAGGFVMDYRNSDGSVAEMCGNGARVFARFLVDSGWVPPGRFEFETRGGSRTAELATTGDVRIGMGPVPVTLGGDSVVTLRGNAYPGRTVDVGNPHLVCLIDEDPAILDLRDAPGFDGELFADGVNIEFVRPNGSSEVTMRVYERGAGETKSCGTGTVAAAAVHLAAQGLSSGTVHVTVPGGRVTVVIDADGTADLIGPAVLVYSGTFNPELLA